MQIPFIHRFRYRACRHRIVELVLLFLALVLIPHSGSGQRLPPPNVIVILADDLGYGDLGFDGCPDFPTPNIDALAHAGVICTNGYSTHPFCSPSRAGLITGRYQQRFGYENNPSVDTSNPRLGPPNTEMLLPQLLKPVGYICGAIGKWHLGANTVFHPDMRGFDSYYGFLGGSSTYLNATVLRDYTPMIETEYLTDAISREAETFINGHATQPFFLYLAYNAPHAPYQATQEYLDRVSYITDPDRRTLAAMITALDDGVGRVVNALEANNLLGNTLIFFLSDNGAPDQSFVRNLPFRGYKSDTTEGGIHVPYVVRWTGVLPAGATYDEPVSALDIVPTVAAVAGAQLPTDRTYDGLNLIPYLTGQQIMPGRSLFWRWFGLGDNGPAGSQDTIFAVRQGPLKLVTERASTGQPPELFNLPTDLGETENLATSQPEDVARLSGLYDQWNLDLIAPQWQFNSGFLFGYTTNLLLAGDWDNFNLDDNKAPWFLTHVTAPGSNGTPDGFNWWINTIKVKGSNGNTTPGQHSFVIVGGRSYENQWGGVNINIDGPTFVPAYSGPGLGPLNTITFEDNFYYSFRILEPLNWPESMARARCRMTAFSSVCSRRPPHRLM